jgi:hypothetical protein
LNLPHLPLSFIPPPKKPFIGPNVPTPGGSMGGYLS